MAKVWIVDVESLETRYTCQWQIYLPELFKKAGHQVEIISGPTDIPDAPTPGMFLNFGGTNVYKSRQVEAIARLFCSGAIAAGDHFIFTDAWHPGIINLKYMSELLQIPITMHGIWHAGSYDPQDGLGRLIGDKPWVRFAEKAFYEALDHSYFASNFHIGIFNQAFGDDRFWLDDQLTKNKIIRTGFPFEYLHDVLKPFKSTAKKDLILFPHRIAPEKQVEIFKDLANQLPQYEFVVCQENQLTKDQYHNLLGQAKIVFSANLQETLGISCFEGAILDAVPMVPDRLSYEEMYFNEFKYPSNWTCDFGSYKKYRDQLCHHIITTMTHYDRLLPNLKRQTADLSKRYFSAQRLIDNFS